MNAGDVILQTLRSEFADIGDMAQTTRVVLRLLLAALLGGVLGYEREQQGKAAGIRTHMLVAMGAAMFVLIPQQGGMLIEDMSRVIQGIVAGIGFLGAGAIIKHQSEASVKGLTTAAGVWLTAAIGIACGLGRESTAVISTLLALAVLMVIPRLAEPDPAPQESAGVTTDPPDRPQPDDGPTPQDGANPQRPDGQPL